MPLAVRSPSFSATISVHAFQSHGIESMQLAQLLRRGSTPGGRLRSDYVLPLDQHVSIWLHVGTSDATRPSASQSDIVAGTIRDSGKVPSSYAPSNHQPGCTRPGYFPDSSGLTGLLQGNSCPYINVRYRALTCPDSSRITQPRRNANRVTTGVFGVTKSAFPGRA
jgi:hypothetical protein